MCNKPLFQQGFSLLEAIVALVILSAGLLAAYSWFDRGFEALIRMDRLALEESVVQETIERLYLQDLDKTNNGKFEWGDYFVVWSSDLYEPSKKGVANVGTTGFYDISLYQVNLEVLHTGRPIARYDFLMQHMLF